MMEWNKCEKEFIKEVEVDEERAKSIVDRAFQRKKIVEKIDLNEANVSFIVEGYYEVIKELLVAYLLLNGLRSKNHQCMITYFYKQNLDYEYEANLISQLSYYRNRLNYYGEKVPLSFYEKNKKDILEIIKVLKEKLRFN